MNLIAQRLIEAEMKLAGVQPEHHDIVAAVLSQTLRQSDDGEVDVIDDAGNIRIGSDTSNMTIGELLSELKGKSPVFFRPPPSLEAKPAVKTLTERMAATIAVERSNAGNVAKAAEIAAHGNPWSKSSWNMTRQGLISNLDPERAAGLKASAT